MYEISKHSYRLFLSCSSSSGDSKWLWVVTYSKEGDTNGSISARHICSFQRVVGFDVPHLHQEASLHISHQLMIDKVLNGGVALDFTVDPQ